MVGLDRSGERMRAVRDWKEMLRMEVLDWRKRVWVDGSILNTVWEFIGPIPRGGGGEGEGGEGGGALFPPKPSRKGKYEESTRFTEELWFSARKGVGRRSERVKKDFRNA